MVPRTRAPFAALPLLAALALPAAAAVPSASNSTVPQCIAACPLGDLHIVVVVRDLANNVLNGASVVLDFANCPGAFICTNPPNDPYVINEAARTVRLFADVLGQADFPLRVGGGCGADSVRVYANGVLLATRALASPDQDGDGLTANLLTQDAAIFAAKLGTNDPTADFDCDGDVDADDAITFNQHATQACEGWVDPTRRSTWGAVKSYYR